ncbi:DoxX family membrane protein [uncultured Winogradskyella sp.]|uniref:DoxX family protein n=1 Tax=uncultured Winogradskyella sp. TaxID=395353 RepID=UPI002605792B|nr:DoxX family membrane protein [uncultured Winogradskyella sp.]
MDDIIVKKWNLSQRFFLRFIFLYFILYVCPYGLEYIYKLNTNSFTFWNDITIWFGELVYNWEFNKDYLYPFSDSKFEYSRLTLIILISSVGSLIWTFLIDLKFKIDYDTKLKTLLITLIRYHVGFVLINFGLSKVFGIQFGEMSLDTLESQIGDNYGMTLLWSFMSYSKFFTYAAGFSQLIGGVLLLFRKTAFIGALICFITMVNVVLMNIGYNVTIKIVAIHLLVMTIILLQQHIKRMIDFFILNKPTSPQIRRWLFDNTRFKKTGLILKIIVLGYFTITKSFSLNESLNSYVKNDYEYMTAFHKIETFVVNGDTIPDTKSNKDRWRSLSFNGTSYYPEVFAVITNNKWNPKRYTFKADTLNKTITYYPLGTSEKELEHITKNQLTYKIVPGKREYIFNGIHESDTIWFKTKFKTVEDYELTNPNNKLHWIVD